MVPEAVVNCAAPASGAIAGIRFRQLQLAPHDHFEHPVVKVVARYAQAHGDQWVQHLWRQDAGVGGGGARDAECSCRCRGSA